MNKINYREKDEIVNSPQSCTSPECSLYRTSRDGVIDTRRQKRDTGIQYRHEKKEDHIPKPIARPEYGTVYQHQGMLLQNLHHRYLYIVIQLPHLKDLDQNCIFKQMIIDWTNMEVTGISGIRIEMPNEAKVLIFTDNDLTHITDDHF